MDQGKGIAWVREADPAMNGAVRKGRDTLPVLRKYLSHPSTDVTSIQLKVRLTQGEENEHVWLADVALQGDGFVGTITNRIEYVSGYKLGERIKVRPGTVSDWMVVTTKGIRGAYSLQVILERERP